MAATENTDLILPIPGKRNILITSALPYVNNVPHLGNIVGSVLSADVFSRYSKARGENTLFICGTDEYGTATETKALQEGLTPQQICDKYHKIHKEIYEWFDIKFDKFGRTSAPVQTDITQGIFLDLHKNGYSYEESMQQLYCENCKTFLADRFVEGTCPLCGFPDARGDQCDSCGKLINAIELVKPVCKIDGSTPIIKSTEHIFLNLTKISDKLEAWVDEASAKGKWAPNAIHVTKSWLKEGLKGRCITRDLKWGVPVPLDKFSHKVFYVWFDAPIGYISITASYTDQWKKWWHNPKEVQLYQFMGKDNIPFHTVVFPSSLIATGQDWTLLHHVNTTEYLNYEGGKFSKSRNLGVFGNNAKETGIPSEVWRYYLLVNRPETSDSSFSWDDLMDKNNNELIANLGNFINRALAFTHKSFEGKVPEFSLNEEDRKFVQAVNEHIAQYIQALDNVELKDGLKITMAISKLGNKYLQDNKPWDLLKTDVPRCATIMAVAVNLVHVLACLLEPYMPSVTAKVFHQMNLQGPVRIRDNFTFDIAVGHLLGTPEILFKRIEPKDIAQWRQLYGGKSETAASHGAAGEAFPADLRGARILTVGDHPNDPNLFLITVDCGKSEQRQLVARLKGVYTAEELQGRNVVVLCNLPPADFKGVKSEAMMLVGEGKKAKNQANAPSKLLQPEFGNNDNNNNNNSNDNTTNSGNWPGTIVLPEGVASEGRAQITLKEFQKLDLKIDKDGRAVYKQKHKLQAGSVAITAPGIDSGKIK